MIRKLNHHLKQRGAIGTLKRLKKCIDENGVKYSIKQIFIPLQITSAENIHLPFTIPGSLKETQEEKKVEVVESPQTPQKIVPRPSGLRKYPESGLETILDLRLPGSKGIFVQAPVIDWEVPLFQRPQHMAIAMAKTGYLVFYVTLNWIDDVDGFIEVYPNLFITNRLDVPFSLTDAYVSIYSTSPFYTPEQLNDIKKKNKIVYEYIDHIDEKISGDYTPKLIKQFDHISDKTVDIVAVSGKVLIEDITPKVSKNKIVYVPNGVEFEHYQSAISAKTDVPEKLQHILSKNKPIVGYFGAMAPWLWYELIEDVTNHLPDFEFVFIGPDYYGGVNKLPVKDNFHYLGTIDYKVLPSYARYFDVAIIPFSPGQIAKTTSPLKLFEYFALKKPVVVTSEMVECVAFQEVYSANTAFLFAEKIKEAYSQGKSVEYTNRLYKLALENSWEKRASALDSVIQKKSS